MIRFKLSSKGFFQDINSDGIPYHILNLNKVAVRNYIVLPITSMFSIDMLFYVLKGLFEHEFRVALYVGEEVKQ
ncbi:hypothetical protein OSO01_25040 [Oceanobacillus sojae]|uniref:Uncharacterized protein n=1 Tax=Oceanobacillus sojae TaxID=582851 RepID=A0A511ZK15_9BACI|nr:hypothetical protein OSO01_25040 [Oceanobacillus sojae]